MKRLILTIAAASTLVSAQAQLFSQEAWSGALWGSLIGGLAGADCHHGFSGSGAAIGAGVGLLAGAAFGEAQRQSYYAAQPYYYPPVAPYVQPGYGYVYAPASLQLAPPAVRQEPQSYGPTARPVPVPQIPDAPRVPDAPTF